MKKALVVPIPFALVKATPFKGMNLPLSRLSAEREMSTDLPAKDLGTVVSECVEKVESEGFDIKSDGITILLTFE